MSSKNQRRLAAVMSADVVGYSRLMAEDELGALEAIRRHRGRVAAVVEICGRRNLRVI